MQRLHCSRSRPLASWRAPFTNMHGCPCLVTPAMKVLHCASSWGSSDCMPHPPSHLHLGSRPEMNACCPLCAGSSAVMADITASMITVWAAADNTLFKTKLTEEKEPRKKDKQLRFDHASENPISIVVPAKSAFGHANNATRIAGITDFRQSGNPKNSKQPRIRRAKKYDKSRFASDAVLYGHYSN